MTINANKKLTLTVSLTLFFAIATAIFLAGPGPLSAWQDQAWIPGFFSLLFLLLSFYYVAEMDTRKNMVLMLVALIICLALPLAAGLLLMTTMI